MASRYDNNGKFQQKILTSRQREAAADKVREQEFARKRNLEMVARAEALAGTPGYKIALAQYNAKTPVQDEKFRVLFEHANGYFRQGQAAPGRLSDQLMKEAVRQWTIDEQPSGFDKFMETATKVAAVAITGYVGAGLVSALAGAGTSAAVGAPVASVTPGGVTVLGAQTGITTGAAATDAIVSGAVTKGAQGAVTAAVMGGSASEGFKAGAVQGAVGETASQAKALAPSVDLSLPKIETGATKALLVPDIVKQAIQQQAASVPRETAKPETSAEPQYKVDWLKLVGVASGIAGLMALAR